MLAIEQVHSPHPVDVEVAGALRRGVAAGAVPAESGYHATYVALAEALDGAPVTTPARLSRAPGVRCPITLVPR